MRRWGLLSLLASVTSCSVDDPAEVTWRVYPCDTNEVTALWDLGTVGLDREAEATLCVVNDGEEAIFLWRATYVPQERLGRTWRAPEITPAPPAPDPLRLEPGGEAQVRVVFAAEKVGAAQTTLRVEASTHDLALTALVTLTTRVIDETGPVVEIVYGEAVGPTTCLEDELGPRCEMPLLDLGEVSPAGEASAEITIRNRASCSTEGADDPCAVCALAVAPDPERYDVGFGFVPGTNPDAVFSLSPDTLPSLPMADTDGCRAGKVTGVVRFAAPPEGGLFEAVIAVETNDPAAPLVEIPLQATALSSCPPENPVAIATLRALDPDTPGAPYSTPNDLEPLDRIYLDGRQSYDTADPDDPSLVTSYDWEIVTYPAGANPDDFQPQGQGTGLFSFWAPLAGHYDVRLTVTDTDGLESCDLPPSRVGLDIIPKDDLHVQLVWDDGSNDQDLHLTWVGQPEGFCSEAYDCHWRSRRPIWFPDDPAANPTLDIDDTNGFGPENINIRAPQPGTYRVDVHYYGDFNMRGVTPTKNTVRIWINGVQRAEYTRVLTAEKDRWQVADIVWEGGAGDVQPQPSDEAGEVGAVTPNTPCPVGP